MRARLAPAIAVLALCTACASGAPTSATVVTLADFNGQYSGTYNVTSCTADGVFVGFCEGAGFTSGTTLPIVLSLTQSQSTVSGNVTLGSVTGTFQGTVSGGTLTGSATMSGVPDSTITLTISNWNTTITAGALSGSFSLVFRQPSASGSATLSATIAQLHR